MATGTATGALDVRPLVAWITDVLEPGVRRGMPGSYARRLDGPNADVYGVADMACILSTIGRLDPTVDERAAWRAAFDALQDPASGWFVEREPSHLPVHATAFAIAAMDLLDLRPRHALACLDPWRASASIGAWLGGMTWHEHTYLWSHEGAGVASIASLLPDEFEPGWVDVYFVALERYLDPATGMFGVDKPPSGDIDQVGGTFHHLFVYEHHARSLPHAPARLDAVLGLQRTDGRWSADNPFWLTLDGIYLLTRTLRDVPARRSEVEAAVRRASGALMEHAGDPGDAFGGDLGVHAVTAVISALAEAQSFLGPEAVVSDRPLRLVLDRRPFI